MSNESPNKRMHLNPAMAPQFPIQALLARGR